ncbi:DUF1707 and DUF4190 domain-containing protein [Nocardia takedensis]
MTPYSNPNLLAADADRERVVAFLGRNLEEGRLTAVDYAARVEQAWSARTVSELDLTLIDLPPLDWPALPLPDAPVAAPQQNRSNPTATAALWLGILSVLACGVPGLLAVPLGLIGLAEERRNPEPRPATAHLGVILGLLGMVLWLGIYLRSR